DLPTVLDRLPEVTPAVEEPDGDGRHAEIRRRLQVVARENTEPAGVNRKTLVETELHREIGNEHPLVAVAVGPPGHAGRRSTTAAIAGPKPMHIVASP